MPDGIDLKRIIDLDPETTVTDDDYTIVDSTTGGAKKFALGQALGEIKDGLADLKEDLDPLNPEQGASSFAWHIGKTVASSGVISNSVSTAVTNKFAVKGGDRIVNNSNPIGMNSNPTIFYVSDRKSVV